jgi:hypothetical protein
MWFLVKRSCLRSETTELALTPKLGAREAPQVAHTLNETVQLALVYIANIGIVAWRAAEFTIAVG